MLPLFDWVESFSIERSDIRYCRVFVARFGIFKIYVFQMLHLLDALSTDLKSEA